MKSLKADIKSERKEIIPISPLKFEDVEDIVRRLRKKEGVIVDLEDVPSSVAQRMLDFLSGAVFAIKGSIKKIKYKMYILIPDGVKISSVEK